MSLRAFGLLPAARRRSSPQPLTPWRINMAFQQLRRRAGLPQIPLHGLRHPTRA